MTEDTDDFEPPLRFRSADGNLIETIDRWRHLAPPAGGETHWKEGSSAFELANAWTGSGRASVPEDFATLLRSAPQTDSFAAGLALPEAKIALDSYRGNTRNADLLLHGTSADGRTLVTVEAKADEEFGRYVDDELSRVKDKPESNLPKRITALSELLFGAGADARDLRYQLVHGLGATVIEALRREADQAVFVVHEFRTRLTDDAKHEANHQDLRYFMARFAAEYVVPGRLQQVRIAGAPKLPVFVGLATTDVRATPS